MDSVPLVAITANVTLPWLGKDTFQEVDIAGITMPITKHGYIVKDVTKLADTIRRAFQIARSGRPGPVLVDITKDVTAATCLYTPAKPVMPAEKKQYDNEDIKKAAELLKNSEKPLIYVGGGAVISGASKELSEFAEKLDAPVCGSLMSKGSFDENSDRYTGMIGMHGSKTTNRAVCECDPLCVPGRRRLGRGSGQRSGWRGNPSAHRWGKALQSPGKTGSKHAAFRRGTQYRRAWHFHGENHGRRGGIRLS
jgi:acetolactate synthase-1/2/3 large subunit